MLNYENLEDDISKHITKYIEKTKKLKNSLSEIKINEFKTDYSQCNKNLYAVDGSFRSYYKIPESEVYFCGIRIGFIKQSYVNLPNNLYNEDCGAENDFVVLNIEDYKDDAKEILEPRTLLSYIMNRREKQKLCEIASKTTDSIIMVDGSLVESYNNPKLENSYKNIIGSKYFDKIHAQSKIEDLKLICEKNNHILVGVTKDSKLKYKNLIKYETILEKAISIQKIPEDKTYYMNIEKEDLEKYSKDSGFNIVIAKLHSKAIKCHRIDYLKNRDLEKEILPSIAIYSQFNQYLGTPRATQVCDRIAVEIRQRSKQTLREIRKILMKNGLSYKEVMFGETDTNGNLIYLRKEHDILDMGRKAINRTFETEE